MCMCGYVNVYIVIYVYIYTYTCACADMSDSFAEMKGSCVAFLTILLL